MAKRNKSSLETSTEHWNGDALVTVTVNEKYPISSEALMGPGFSIILLNMVFGLLPITLSGSRIKFFHCSISRLYGCVFGLCIIILSGIFVPPQLMLKLRASGPAGTGIILTVLVTLGHVCGFLFLKIRGHWLAMCFPKFWAQLTKLLQKSVIDAYGVEYKQLRVIQVFSRRSVIVYIFLMAAYEAMTYFIESKFIIHLFVVFKDEELMQDPLWSCIVNFGYLMWGMCNLSHILVSMLLCFIVRSITVSLRGINDQLQEIVGKSIAKSTIAAIENEEIEQRMTQAEEKRIFDKLDTFTTCYALCQELTGGLSKAWGISIILEVLIALINIVGQMYMILVGLYNPTPESVDYIEHISEICQALTQGFIHFYFLFRLSCDATEMVEESKLPLTILNMASYQHWPMHIQHKIQMFKMDIANSSISLTASNYFQVNKYLVTSVFGAITTYLIVLMQFSQTEAMRPNCNNATGSLIETQD